MKIKTITPIFLLLLLMLMGVSKEPVKILMAGDSTMADKPLTVSRTDTTTSETFTEANIERGWGQLLPEFISDKAKVLNYARNGRSTRTFIEQGLWSELIYNTSAGDFVIIQFGHNDGVITKKSYTNPAQFRINFVAFVNEVKAKGAYPILCTPVARRRFDNQGNLVKTHGEFPDIIRSVAGQEDVPMIDMEILTSEWLQNAGVKKSNEFFKKFAPGESKIFPNGLDDNTHFNERGAREVAELFIRDAERQGLNEFMKLTK